MVSFFSNLISSITEQGRKLVDKGISEAGLLNKAPVDLAVALLSEKGEVSGTILASDFFKSYQELTSEEQAEFFMALAKDFGPDFDKLDMAIKDYQANPGQVSALKIQESSEAKRQELVRRLNRAVNGTSQLVKIREDLLRHKKTNPELAPVDKDFQHLLSGWFNRGFLVLERISWQTPANILEKIIRYEAVHEIQSWDDLRSRIDPPDRRCYAFFHPALIDEPLIFVEVALSNGIPDAIAPILEEGRDELDVSRADTAVFYSISNCQKGLKGISFGNFLIKQVVQTLLSDLPHLKTFVTLSPAPTFTRWLAGEIEDKKSEVLIDEEKLLLKELQKKNWQLDENQQEYLQETLTELAATYYLRGKDRYGNPYDPVARFHLGNGARLEQINWLADRSEKATENAAGFMVNYLYKLNDIEKNHEQYAKNGQVISSKHVARLSRNIKKETLE